MNRANYLCSPNFLMILYVHRGDCDGQDALANDKHKQKDHGTAGGHPAKANPVFWKVDTEDWDLLKSVRPCPGYNCDAKDDTPFYGNIWGDYADALAQRGLVVWDNTIIQGAKMDFSEKYPEFGHNAKVSVQILSEKVIWNRSIACLGEHNNSVTLGHLAQGGKLNAVEHIIVEYSTTTKIKPSHLLRATDAPVDKVKHRISPFAKGSDGADETLPITLYFGEIIEKVIS
ncbi:hypothetical protein F5Y18DRAFT_428163 [Xylariaceae sp. FL1019]|nr:hypothetical protein F5Y18DRAFT_428163 [Xylariaceae sp. FL1019]